MGECADGVTDHYPSVIKNLLEFPGGFGASMRGQIGLAACIDRIEGSEGSLYTAARLAQFIGNSGLQQIDRPGRIALVQRDERAKGWQVTESDRRADPSRRDSRLSRDPVRQRFRPAMTIPSRYRNLARRLDNVSSPGYILSRHIWERRRSNGSSSAAAPRC
jgi:hypothetical protein